MLSIITKSINGSYDVKLIGEVDIYTVDNLKKSVNELMDKEIKNILFDFIELEYIDSTGLGALIGIRGKYKDIEIEIVNLKSNVKRLFDITGLTKIFLVK
ncbi:anti-sigma factor antagonist [Alkalibaculum sp. M08DMB]|uniref:Anti-sigma factor antagonist n=1 Tax=Alkalibaculum sporogenes TaxID=2655001 RepID=A0A6A7K9N3_9FIRM|nr:STAS domain-containing protein [Alkalibaculum sporogenes]MPW26198.1 anti-sigma factor antagonist [Alkalibaculum sporogenes]